MNTSKRSSTPVKNGDKGVDRRKGISHYQSMIALERSKDKPDTILIRNFEKIIECLEKKIETDKRK